MALAVSSVMMGQDVSGEPSIIGISACQNHDINNQYMSSTNQQNMCTKLVDDANNNIYECCSIHIYSEILPICFA